MKIWSFNFPWKHHARSSLFSNRENCIVSLSPRNNYMQQHFKRFWCRNYFAHQGIHGMRGEKITLWTKAWRERKTKRADITKREVEISRPASCILIHLPGGAPDCNVSKKKKTSFCLFYLAARNYFLMVDSVGSLGSERLKSSLYRRCAWQTQLVQASSFYRMPACTSDLTFPCFWWEPSSKKKEEKKRKARKKSSVGWKRGNRKRKV